MDKLNLILLLSFIIIGSLYTCIFFIYLHSQYEKASLKYYKKKLKARKYYVALKEKNNNSKIKNNTTEIINPDSINNRVGYAMLEFIDEYGIIIKTQTIFKSNFSIGRDNSNDLILHGQKVSRRQCLIIRQNNSFYICNLSETNSTILNETLIKNSEKLFFGDVIKIANYTLRFQDIINEPCAG